MQVAVAAGGERALAELLLEFSRAQYRARDGGGVGGSGGAGGGGAAGTGSSAKVRRGRRRLVPPAIKDNGPSPLQQLALIAAWQVPRNRCSSVPSGLLKLSEGAEELGLDRSVHI